MILGERASTDSVRSGAKKAVIEGTFDEAGTPRIGELLDANEIDPLPGGAGQIILRRQITDRQSRGFVNDTPATLDVMRAVAAELIDLHGQHEHQSLLKTEKHLQLLDHFGSLGDLRRTYQQHHDRVAALVEERDELTARRERLEEKRQLYEFQIEEIDEVAPEEGEDERLDAERRRLSNAEHLFEATQELYRRLYEAEDAINDRLVVARNELQDLARIDDAFTEQLDEIESAQISVAEAASFLQDYGARIEFDPGRLSEIRERVQELERLKRKYGGSLEAVLDHRAKIGEEHELAADVEGALGDLANKIEAAQRALTEAARRLSEKRKEVATRIEEAILEELAKLGMPESRFEVRFTREEREDGWILPEDDQDGNARHAAFQRGMDRAEFYISTNVGEKLRPLREVASGGEISRIMLALKTILAKSERLPILVFDEIDIGISGGIARKVGRSMHDLASYHQIIAITHLPQIAALGDEHFRVAKHVEEGRTVTGIERLGEDEQAAQVATLIGGEDVTGAALENARELMKPAGDGAASDGAARANAPAGEG
jgi:DNA repair protein RecN (Recombination protein N)